MKSLYEELGVARDATEAQIKAAHRKGVREHHPDKQGCREKFQRVQRAYEVLSDPAKRKHYDETGDDGSTRPAGPTAEQVIAMAWLNVLEQIDPRQHLIEALHATLLHGLEETRKALKKSEAKRDRMKTASERLSVPQGSVLRDVLETQIAKLEAVVAGERHGCDVMAAAVNLVTAQGARYRADESRRERPSDSFGPMMDEILREAMGMRRPREGREWRDGNTSTFGGL